MACATLKRSLDWESINQRPTKRRRCIPFGGGNSSRNSPSSSSSSSTSSSLSLSSLSSSSSPSTSRNISKNAGANFPYEVNKNESYWGEATPSIFAGAVCPKIPSEKMANNIRMEIKRLHKCKQLPLTSSQHTLESMQDSESSGSEMGAESPHRPESPPSIVRNPEKALFTFKQVQLICERMLKEREDELREKYDAVLTTKLAEQYDAFVKFTYDQIQRRYEAAPSYLS